MAAPRDVDMKNFSGSYKLNKELSDPFDEIMAVQGIPWLIRQAAKYLNPEIKHLHFVFDEGEDKGREGMIIEAPGVAGLPPRKDEFAATGIEKSRHFPLMGEIKGYLKRSSVEELKAISPYLVEGWEPESFKGPVEEGYYHLHGISEAKKTVSDAVWGFGQVNGERYFIKKTHMIHKEKNIYDLRMVMNYCE